MGVLDKFLDAIKLNDDYGDEEDYLNDDLDEDEEDDTFLDEDEESRPKKSFFQKFSMKRDPEEDIPEEEEEAPGTGTSSASRSAAGNKVTLKSDKVNVRPSSKITPMRSSRRSGNSQSSNVEVCVIRPSSMEDSREIADTLADNCAVILNLEGLDMELAQRIIDFTSGACYSLGGSLKQVSSYIFVLGSYNVDITGDLHNILGGATPSVRAGY